MAHPQIAAFARLAEGGEAPKRVIFGQVTRLSRTTHDIRYNEQRDEIYVTNPFAQAVLTFKGDATANQPPIRMIQGPKTQLGAIDTLTIDPVNNEILVPDADHILVYPLTANGDVAPIRILQGGDQPGWRPGSGIDVDPVHNLLVTDGTLIGSMKDDLKNPYRVGRDAILIFNRTASGQAKPLRVIRGEKTGIYGIRQMQVYPKNGWIIISQITDGSISEPKGTFVGVWSIYDNGNVPPRWRIDGRPSNILKKPRGVAYDVKHKEVIVSDMRLNAVLTFAFPEIFDQEAKPPM